MSAGERMFANDNADDDGHSFLSMHNVLHNLLHVSPMTPGREEN